MFYEDRTAQGPKGGAIGVVDDHTKMTDDFTEFVEKMVGFFVRVQDCCFRVFASLCLATFELNGPL